MQSGLKSNNRLMDFNQKSFEKHLNCAKKFLSEGSIYDSWNSFHDALTVNFESVEAKSGMKIAVRWPERKGNLPKTEHFFEEGELLVQKSD